jgi:hypothetical protein
MERRIFHGNITPQDLARALTGAFHRGNLRTQVFGDNLDKLVVQVATTPIVQSGGPTAITITLNKVEDGVMVEVGEQSWFGVAASMGSTALSALRNPWNLIGRLDDIAQDFENIQLPEKIWQVIDKTAREVAASTQISERLQRITCEYCGAANPVGEGNCIACGAPMGKMQPRTCPKCGFVTLRGERTCPGCGQLILE